MHSEINHTIVRLISELCRAGVRYCHWKSNEALAKSASGENDLDLLVCRDDLTIFREVLMKLGLKLARSSGFRNVPGIEDYYGYDESTGLIFHVHAHYRLVVGHDASKSIVLPIEKAYIASARLLDGQIMPTPAVEMEFIVFCLRMVLKFTLFGALRGRPLLGAGARREYEWLGQRVNMARVRELQATHLPMISSSLFESCISSVAGDTGIIKRGRTYWRLRRALRGCERMGVLQEVWRRQSLRAMQLVSRLRRKPLLSERGLAGGGLVIAIVGGDGSGKSSAIGHLAAWLGGNFKVTQLHMGKPPRRFSTLQMDAFSRITSLARRGEVQLAHRGLVRYLHMFRSVLYARDRYYCHKDGHRKALHGDVVICDRHYLPFVQSMDGAECERLGGPSPDRICRWLTRLEHGYLARIMPPHVLLHLAVPPELAVARKTTEDAAYVRERNERIMMNAELRKTAWVIDASADRDSVCRELRKVVWGKL